LTQIRKPPLSPGAESPIWVGRNLSTVARDFPAFVLINAIILKFPIPHFFSFLFDGSSLVMVEISLLVSIPYCAPHLHVFYKKRRFYQILQEEVPSPPLLESSSPSYIFKLLKECCP